MQRPKIAILDDYQDLALKLADWSGVQARADLTVFAKPWRDEDEIADKLASFDVIVLLRERTPLPAGLIARLPRLRVVAMTGNRTSTLDLAACKARGIVVTNTPDVLTNACADFAWGLIIAVTRRLGEAERQLRRGAWAGWALDHMLGMELRGKRLGLVGVGRIGRAVAEKAPAFGMTVAYAEPMPLDLPGAQHLPLDHLLATSDVISLHVPLMPETRHLIDQKALTKMKRTAYLINTSRGPVVDEAALAWALKQRLIAGAALDVYENEPQVHPDLLGLENVMLIPHIASATTETRTAMADLAASNVLAVLAGGTPLTQVA